MGRGLNTLTFAREGAFAVPLIDGTPLHELCGDDFEIGIQVELVAPPSRHLLGVPEYVGEGGVVLLDGGCMIADCCGVMARIDVGDRIVTWRDLWTRGSPDLPPDLRFTFDRVQYEQALASVGGAGRSPSRS